MKLNKFLSCILVSAVIAGFSGCTDDSSDQSSNINNNSTEVFVPSASKHRAAFNFAFTLDGEIYEIPMYVSEFLRNGWNLDSDKMLEPYTFGIVSSEAKKNDLLIPVKLMNNTPDECSVTDADIGVVTLNTENMKANEHEIKYVNIVLGHSNKDDVIADLDEPTTTESDYIKYEYSEGAYVEFHFDNENNIVEEIIINNLDRYCHGG